MYRVINNQTGNLVDEGTSEEMKDVLLSLQSLMKYLGINTTLLKDKLVVYSSNKFEYLLMHHAN
tara:strand:- start:185 stop:376 length:192 start_codon:yes stop_codon:yes gene_type:complete